MISDGNCGYQAAGAETDSAMVCLNSGEKSALPKNTCASHGRFWSGMV